MGTIVTPPLVDVTGPTLSFPAPFGLMSVVEPATPSDPHWLNGLEWDHPSCGGVTGISAECADAVDITTIAPLGNSRGVGVGSPFTLFATHTCSPVSNSETDAKALATQVLLRHQQEAIEEIISSNSLDTVPTLIDSASTFDNIAYADATVLGGAAVSVRRGLGLLANHAALNFGTSGAIIHAPRFIAPYLPDAGVTRVSGHLETLTGELVSAGAGYANLSPDGTAAGIGQAWVFATPPVLLATSDPIATILTGRLSGFETRTNDMNVRAARPFVVGWDNCTIAAVLVNLT